MLALAFGQPVTGTVIGVCHPQDSRHRWLMVDAFPESRQGEHRPWRVFTVFSDITARRQAEEALRQSEERFRLTFQTSPDAVNLNRLADGLYVDISQGFTDLTGYGREEVIGTSSLAINIWHDPRDRERLINSLREHGQVDNLEARFRRKDGSIGYGQMSARVTLIDGVPQSFPSLEICPPGARQKKPCVPTSICSAASSAPYPLAFE